MSEPDLVIFDCDGVLVDSEIIAARVDADLLTEAGYPIEAGEVALQFSGLTFRDMLMRIEQMAGIPLQASLIDRAEALLDERLKDVQAVEGAAKAIASVKGPRCICSNSTPERLELSLGVTGLRPLFGPHVYSAFATPSKRTKPAPDVFLHAAAAMNADPRNTFVVEDSVHGIHGAKAAGMRVIGFTGGAHSYPSHADILTEAGAETAINRWRDFPAVLEALTEWADA